METVADGSWADAKKINDPFPATNRVAGSCHPNMAEKPKLKNPKASSEDRE